MKEKGTNKEVNSITNGQQVEYLRVENRFRILEKRLRIKRKETKN